MKLLVEVTCPYCRGTKWVYPDMRCILCGKALPDGYLDALKRQMVKEMCDGFAVLLGKKLFPADGPDDLPM